MDPSAYKGIIALLGNPVSHSLSPVIHNAAFRASGYDMRYEAVDVPPSELESVVNRIRRGDYAGANVTIPHKESVMEHLDALTPAAASLGAVNTIRVIHSGADNRFARLEGDNTDASGFAKTLAPYGTRLKDSSCVVWGAGGAARAVVYTLLHRFHVSRVTLISRSVDRALGLARSLGAPGSRIRALPWEAGTEVFENASLLVNATPLGMTPQTDTTPCTNPGVLRRNQIVYDLVYNPRNTRLLRDARAHGAETIGGLEMLIAQASQSFRIWTGTEMPVDIVRTELDRYLRENA